MECAAIQDVLVVGKSLDENESRDRKVELDRIAAMLSRLGKRGYAVEEEPSNYGIDPDLLRHLRLAPSIAMKQNPNQTLHSTRTSRASELSVRQKNSPFNYAN